MEIGDSGDSICQSSQLMEVCGKHTETPDLGCYVPGAIRVNVIQYRYHWLASLHSL